MDNQEAINPVRIGQQLRAWRVARGWTQSELARRTGTMRPLISRCESGRHLLQLEVLERLLTALNVQMADLFRERENEERP